MHVFQDTNQVECFRFCHGFHDPQGTALYGAASVLQQMLPWVDNPLA
jgi:hypothetical protein